MKVRGMGGTFFTLSYLFFIGVSAHPSHDYATACYENPLPSTQPSNANRTIPWGSPSIKNGSQTCCSSLDEVRAGIDQVDEELLRLLSQRYGTQSGFILYRGPWRTRAAYVREATRFKATRNSVDVPARDQEVIDRAVENATAYHLPKTIAKAVFGAIINSSVSFEYCVVSCLSFRISSLTANMVLASSVWLIWLCMLVVKLFTWPTQYHADIPLLYD